MNRTCEVCSIEKDCEYEFKPTECANYRKFVPQNLSKADVKSLLGEERKPPLGIIPEYYYERGRIQDLARAIHEYAGDCRQGENLIVWAEELKERLLKWNRLSSKL